MLFPVLGLALVSYSIFGRMRNYPAVMDRSLQIAEESLQLQRQAVALQSETNRLLGLLVEGRSGGA